MTQHFGNVPAGSTLYIPFTTYAGATGASVTMSGLAVTDIEIYKNGSATQRSSDAGYTLLDTDGIDFDGITGVHGFSVNLGDNTDSGFYSVGGQYWVVVSAVTVDSQTVNFIAATFRIVVAENTAGVPVADAVRIGGATQTAANVGEVANRLATLIEAAPGSPNEFRFTADALERVRIVLGMAAGNMDAQLATKATAAALAIVAGYLDTEVAAILAAVDTEVAAIKTKTDFLPSVAAGASGGLFISGANTGHVSISDGLEINTSTADRDALTLTGDGAGWGARITGGADAGGLQITSGETTIPALDVLGQFSVSDGIAVYVQTTDRHALELTGDGIGCGIRASSTGASGMWISGGTDVPGVQFSGSGTAPGLRIYAEDTGPGLSISGGGTSGHGIRVTAGNGDALRLEGGTSGAGLHAVGGATSGVGMLLEGTGGGADISADAIDITKAIAVRVETMLEAAPGSPGESRFTVDALVNAPSGSGGGGGGLDAAGVRAAIGLASANLDAQLAAIDNFIDTEVDDIRVVTARLGTMLEAAPGSPGEYRFTVDSLELAPTGSGGGGGGGPSAVEIADEVQTRTIAAVSLVNALAANSVTASALASDAVAEIQSGLALQTSVDDLPTSAELATALGTADDAVLAQVALVKAKTDLIPASPAAVGDIPTAAQNADKVLGRNIAGGSDGGRTVTQALRPLRNRWDNSSGSYVVYEEDDTTPSWSSAISSDPAAEPVTGSNPA